MPKYYRISYYRAIPYLLTLLMHDVALDPDTR